MHAKILATLALALLPELLAARAVEANLRRGVDCQLGGAANSGGACGSFAASGAPGPTQPGIASNCDKFHKVVSGDACGAIEAQYGISGAQFSQWNPSIDSQCSNLWLNYYVCVHVAGGVAPPFPGGGPSAPIGGAPSPTQPGISKACDGFYKVVSGDQCNAIEAKYGISKAQFSEWNPFINSDCSNLWANYYVCVHASGAPGKAPPSSPPTSPNNPQPQMPNLDRNCRAFHQVASGDYCAAIATANHISLADFHKWNPTVDANCNNLWVGYYVCVAA